MILPYQTVVLQSSRNEAQVLERLRGDVEPGPWLRHEYSECLFEGIVEGPTFQVRRLGPTPRYDFRPWLHGRIEPGVAGRAIVTVAFRPDPIARGHDRALDTVFRGPCHRAQSVS